MKKNQLLTGMLLLLGLAAPLWAQKAYTPAAGSAERKSMMDVLRIAVADYYSDFFTKENPPVFTVQHLKVAGDWAYAEVSTQPVVVAADKEPLENMSSVDRNAGSDQKSAKWTVSAWALYHKEPYGWDMAFNSTNGGAKDYEMSLDEGRAEAYRDMRKRYPKAPASIFPK